MSRSLLKPILFFDFDNTLTQGDVLDDLIERYSPNEFWRDWENAWAKGDLPARDCLRLQVENMRVPRARLLEDVARVRIDPSFAEIVDWARRHQVEVQIVSDSFLPLIRHILHANGIAGIPVLAKHVFGDLWASGDRTAFANTPLWNEQWVGLGPYRLTRWERSSFIEGTAFDQYFAGRPKIDPLTWTRRSPQTWCSRRRPSPTSSTLAAWRSIPSTAWSRCSPS